ncbi:MAG TPA: DUF1656 domain-containing protein [Acetobacteraceae bacterium]|nr:DUF1656 domain-containing protein [Acetobacteraceae bacterium]
MIGEIDLYGVFVPTFLVCSVVALVVLAMLRRALRRIGVYRLVWHGPLVNLALFVIVLAAVTAGLQRWMS